MYKTINEYSVLLKETGAVIPLPAGESYGFAYEAWLAEGNTTEPADHVPNPRIAESLSYLTSTDWYYARLAETGQAVPQDVVANRLAAREYINELI